MNVARLLNKKFRTGNPSPFAGLSYMAKTGNQKHNMNKHNQINKLLKIYENSQK